jgi:hypothetical protein
MKVFHSAAGGTDTLSMNGSGFSDDGNNDVLWVDDEKDQSGTSYVAPADWTWSIIGAGERGIDWSPGGAEPPATQPYWLQFEMKGDIIIPIGNLILLSEVEFTL